jgi:uncharacterized protein with beta-barrel porin domain
MPSLSTLKLIGYGLGALAIIGLLAMVNGWRVERNHLRDWQTTVVSATRDASGNPKLAAKDVPQQITFLGQAVTALSNSLKVQNAAVASLGSETARQQQQAAQARQKAAQSAHEADASAQRLDASSRQTPPAGPPCAPSKAVEEQWR